MLLLVAFHGRSIQNPSANRQIIFEKCSCRSNQHLPTGTTVMPFVHADWMYCFKSSNQRGANNMTVAPWHTKSWWQMLVTSTAAFLENYLAVSAWILNGSSMECHEKKRQPSSLSSVRSGSQAILISG